MRSRFNFLKNRSETASQRSTSYLESLGVPANVVSTVTTDPAPPAWIMERSSRVREEIQTYRSSGGRDLCCSYQKKSSLLSAGPTEIQPSLRLLSFTT